MRKYRFRVSQKVKVWIDDYVEVEANDLAEALGLVNDRKPYAVNTGWETDRIECYNSETDYNCVETMTKEENNGNDVERIEYIGSL